MILTKIKPFSASVLIIAAMMLAAMPVSAVAIEGAGIMLDVEPGMTYTTTITLHSEPDEPEGNVSIDVQGLCQSPFDGSYTALEAAEDTGLFTARQFITLNASSVHLEPGGQAEITATIAVPADAEDGGRYAAIPARREASGPEQAAVIPVFLSIRGGNITETGEITALEYTSTEAGGDVVIATWFLNTGNHHISDAVGNVTILDARGAVAGRAVTTPFEQALIPGSEVRFSVSIGADLPDAEYLLIARIERQDGTLLAEQNESLPGRGNEGENPASESSDSGKTSVPGFGTGTALLAVLLGFAGLKKTWLR